MVKIALNTRRLTGVRALQQSLEIWLDGSVVGKTEKSRRMSSRSDLRRAYQCEIRHRGNVFDRSSMSVKNGEKNDDKRVSNLLHRKLGVLAQCQLENARRRSRKGKEKNRASLVVLSSTHTHVEREGQERKRKNYRLRHDVMVNCLNNKVDRLVRRRINVELFLSLSLSLFNEVNEHRNQSDSFYSNVGGVLLQAHNER